jgi:uncharacterized protein (TIGR00296 family)
MSIVASIDHAAYCFDVLSAHLQGQQAPVPAFAETALQCPLFVTWKIQDRDSEAFCLPSSSVSTWKLRGCIGTFQPQPIAEGLRKFALSAALRDSRFEPIQRAELSQLQCGISFLVDFQPASSVTDWVIGEHGIQIRFTVQGQSYSGTYLPEVASEQGWTHLETLESLVKKSGTGTFVDAFEWLLSTFVSKI